jgi:fatty acid desaturase
MQLPESAQIKDQENERMVDQVQRNNDHGQTLAAWILTASVIIGSALIALGIFFSVQLLWIVGIAVGAVGSVVSYVLHQLGYGQKPRA